MQWTPLRMEGQVWMNPIPSEELCFLLSAPSKKTVHPENGRSWPVAPRGPPHGWEAGCVPCRMHRKPLAQWFFPFHNYMKLPINNLPAVKQCELIYLLSIFTINSFRVSIKFLHITSASLLNSHTLWLFAQSNDRNFPLIIPTLYPSWAFVCIHTGQ